jgi:hypothetical protein
VGLEVAVLAEEHLADGLTVKVVLGGVLRVHREPAALLVEDDRVLLVGHEAHAVAAEGRGDHRKAARRLAMDDHEADLVARLADADVDALAAVAAREPAAQLLHQEHALRLLLRVEERLVLDRVEVDEAAGLLRLDAGMGRREDVGVLEVEAEGEVFGADVAARREEVELALAGEVQGGFVPLVAGQVGDIEEGLLELARHGLVDRAQDLVQLPGPRVVVLDPVEGDAATYKVVLKGA